MSKEFVIVVRGQTRGRRAASNRLQPTCRMLFARARAAEIIILLAAAKVERQRQ